MVFLPSQLFWVDGYVLVIIAHRAGKPDEVVSNAFTAIFAFFFGSLTHLLVYCISKANFHQNFPLFESLWANQMIGIPMEMKRLLPNEIPR